MSGAAEYDASSSKRTRWGDITALDSGGWLAIWTIGFASELPPSAGLFRHHDPDVGFTATLRPQAARRAELRIATREHAMAAEYYGLTFHTFRLLHTEVAPLATIQTLPADWYPPLRGSGETS